jgi:hypothetical protein
LHSKATNFAKAIVVVMSLFQRPGGATTGFVTVTTPGGTFTSNKKFRVKR